MYIDRSHNENPTVLSTHIHETNQTCYGINPKWWWKNKFVIATAMLALLVLLIFPFSSDAQELTGEMNPDIVNDNGTVHGSAFTIVDDTVGMAPIISNGKIVGMFVVFNGECKGQKAHLKVPVLVNPDTPKAVLWAIIVSATLDLSQKACPPGEEPPKFGPHKSGPDSLDTVGPRSLV